MKRYGYFMIVLIYLYVMKFLNLFQYFILTEMSDLRPDGMLCTVLDQKSDELVFKSCSEILDINAKLWSYEMVYTLFYIALPGLDCSSTK